MRGFVCYQIGSEFQLLEASDPLEAVALLGRPIPRDVWEIRFLTGEPFWADILWHRGSDVLRVSGLDLVAFHPTPSPTTYGDILEAGLRYLEEVTPANGEDQ